MGAAFFQKGLDLRAQYVSQCGNSDECSICLSKDFSTVMKCSDGQREAVTLLPVAFAEECTYPGGNCYELRQKCKGSNTVTLHGLWPQWKESCSNSFDESEVSGVEDQLKEYWLSCPEYGGDNNDFWSHEWKKHGSCSGMTEAA